MFVCAFSISKMTLFFSFSEVFCGKDGDILKENDTIKFTALAKTYKTIAEEGPDAFYKGDLALNLVNDIQAAGTVATSYRVYYSNRWAPYNLILVSFKVGKG